MEKKHQIDVTIEEFLYYAMFSIMLIMKGIGLEENTILFRTCILGIMVLFFFKIVYGNYSIWELVIISLTVLWGGYVLYNIGSSAILIYAFMAMGMKNISTEKVMKIGAVVWSVCFGATVTAAIFFGRIGGCVVHEKLGLGPILREGLGYAHPNVLHITYILLMVFVLYNCKKQNIIRVSILLLLGDAFVFVYSVSYTGLIISFLIILSNIYYVKRKQFTRLEKLIMKLVLPVCIYLSTFFPVYLYSYGFWYDLLNPLLNNRIWLIKHYFYLYHPTLFGEKIVTEGISLDNSYVYAIGWYGIVFLIVMFAAYVILINKYIKQDRRRELAVIMPFLVAGLTEQFLFNASIKNITFVFLGEMLFSCVKGKQKEFQFISKYNKSYQINVEIFSRIKDKISDLNFNRMLVCFGGIFCVTFLLLCTKRFTSYEVVYANEKSSDCDGELVSGESIIEGENTMIIGRLSLEDNYYYFTRESSNLIKIIEIRTRLSISIDISIIVTVINGILTMRKKKNEI